jgi:LEA14-like dessication related protein
MKKITSIALLAMITIIIACKQPQPLVYKGINNFSLQRASLQHPAIGMDLTFYNPNNYKLKIKKADVDVFIEGKHLGEMMLDTLYVIPARDTFFIPVVLNVDAKNILPDAMHLLLKKEVDIKLVGYIKAGKRHPILNIPINYEAKQPINLNF